MEETVMLVRKTEYAALGSSLSSGTFELVDLATYDILTAVFIANHN